MRIFSNSILSRFFRGFEKVALMRFPQFQNFFLNGRYVKSRTASAAIEQAFVSYIPPEKFPVCVLDIILNPAAVDVNVHPSKLEVKFANERVIFEDLKRSRNQDGRIASQMLLLPVSVIPGDVELSIATEFKSELEAVGFEYIVNENSLDIVSVPEAISPLEAENLFLLMLDELKEGKGNPKVTDNTRRERALYQVACKAAIKGGRIYDRAVLEWLIGKLLLIPDITVCPHGRPVAIKLTKSELDRQFERIK